MIWLLTRLVVLPVKAAAGGFKLGYWTGKVLGYRRILLVGLGVAVGVLFAPGPGAALRERLRARLDGGAVAFPEPPSPATSTVVPPADPASSGAPSAATGGADATGDGSSPDAVDVITASGGVVVATPAGDEEAVGEEVVLGTVESVPPAVDAEPLPAVPDADPAVGGDTPAT